MPQDKYQRQNDDSRNMRTPFVDVGKTPNVRIRKPNMDKVMPTPFKDVKKRPNQKTGIDYEKVMPSPFKDV